MCGIVGFTGHPNLAVLKRMCRSLEHRGPDDEGFFQDASISLAMRRLAVVDVETGRQPVSNENGNIWVVFNGEIYNHAELRRQLAGAGHQFRTHHSDTEVIVHLYEEKGEQWVEAVNGMFAVAIWDAPKRRLMLYRDRIGEKPLYYTVNDGQLFFASEIKALLAHPAVSRTPDWRALYHYFGLKNISAPRTAYREIRQVKPGQKLVWDKGRMSVAPYWQLDFSQTLAIDEHEAAAGLLDLLNDAVRLRMNCDVPYGAYLGGGLDSGSVVSLMCRAQGAPVVTFGLSYEGASADEQADAENTRRMARQLGAEHHEHVMRAPEIPETLPLVMRAFDEPFSGAISTYYLSSLARQHAKVALSGDGADELFGNCLPHRMTGPIEHYLKLEAEGRAEPAAWTDADRGSLGEFADGSSLDLLRKVADRDPWRWRSRLEVFDPEMRDSILTPEFLELAGDAQADDPYAEVVHGTTAHDSLNACLEVDQKEQLPNQVLPFVDRLSMAHSVEARVPFLDHRLIEFACRLPGEYKVQGSACQHVLKQAVRDLLPAEWVARARPSTPPVHTWLKTSLAPYVRATLASEPVRRHGLLRPEAVERMVALHYTGRADLSAQVWNLLCFQVWCDTCLSAA